MKKTAPWAVFVCAAAVILTQLDFPAFGSDHLASYEDVRPILDALVGVLPPPLKVSGESVRRRAWQDWAATHDREIRARLTSGDEDTVVSWLLFGTSFTAQPRALFEVAPTSKDLPQLISARVRDLVSALAETGASKGPSTGKDERRIFAREVLQSKGYRFGTVAERTRVEQHLQSEVERVVAEFQRYARELEAARRSGDVATEATAEARLFRDRGLSLDTSIFPGFSIEQALDAIRKQQLLPAKAVWRVAVIGPGLDFANKNSGYDFYPIQSLQPFTLIDSLVRLGLAARAESVEVTTFDISPRVNDHLHDLRERAKSGESYVLRLPLDLGSALTPELVKYWKSMGDRIGEEIKAPRPPTIGKQLDLRAVSVRPQIAVHVNAVDFNAVTERWNGAPFDIVVATNVLIYYDGLDQALAFGGIEAMLRPGGFFLTNNAVVELPFSRLRSQGFLTVQYSTEPVSGDHIFWYRRN